MTDVSCVECGREITYAEAIGDTVVVPVPATHARGMGGWAHRSCLEHPTEEVVMERQNQSVEPSEALVAFLYILMRDHLPTGKVAKIIEEYKDVTQPNFTSSEVEALARRYAGRLT